MVAPVLIQPHSQALWAGQSKMVVAWPYLLQSWIAQPKDWEQN